MHWLVLHEVLITTRFTDSLHSSKTWGRLTLIEKNRDYSDSFYYSNLFCPAPFMIINKSHFQKWKLTEFLPTFWLVHLWVIICRYICHTVPCTLNLITEANILRNIYFFRCSNSFLIFCTLATLLILFTFAFRQF